MDPKNSLKPMKTDWGDVAQWYDQLVGESGSEYHQKVVLPGTMRLLNAQKGESVIDIACGQGVLCRLLEKTGADRVLRHVSALLAEYEGCVAGRVLDRDIKTSQRSVARFSVKGA